MSSREQEADQMLAIAERARDSREFASAKEFYAQALSILLELYKTSPKGSEDNSRLLAKINNQMSNAESNRVMQAETLIATAKLARTTGELAVAKKNYAEALAILLDLYNSSEKATARSNKLFADINTYMVEAEQIKAELARNGESITPPRINTSSTSAKGTDIAGLSLQESGRKIVKNVPDDYDYTAKAVNKKIPSSPRSPVRPRAATGTSTTGRVSAASSNKAASSGDKPSEYETQIMSEMLDVSPGVHWGDIAGLASAKQTLQEAVILPNLRPDLFVGLRSPPRGALLFGPPGTGKTLLAKAVATESGFTFFSITSSSVTSKYIGEGEKLMKALFTVARKKQPSVIFFDEIDAIMSTRKENEHEASRRLKTEFMTQVDGASTSSDDRLLIMGATNIPWELDEAVLRRLVKRIYVPLPDNVTRLSLITLLLAKQKKTQTGSGSQSAVDLGISSHDLNRIVDASEGYSASDLTALCHEAAMGPIRELGAELLKTVSANAIRNVHFDDFRSAINVIRPSVSPDSLKQYSKWSDQFAVLR